MKQEIENQLKSTNTDNFDLPIAVNSTLSSGDCGGVGGKENLEFNFHQIQITTDQMKLFISFNNSDGVHHNSTLSSDRLNYCNIKEWRTYFNQKRSDKYGNYTVHPSRYLNKKERRNSSKLFQTDYSVGV
ncbi:hypothetical protein ACTA71_009989 [Dictyostelium dimigraforme]